MRFFPIKNNSESDEILRAWVEKYKICLYVSETHNIFLVKLAFEVIYNVRPRRQIRGNQNVGPVLRPTRIFIVVIDCRFNSLNFLQMGFVFALHISTRFCEETNGFTNVDFGLPFTWRIWFGFLILYPNDNKYDEMKSV